MRKTARVEGSVGDGQWEESVRAQLGARRGGDDRGTEGAGEQYGHWVWDACEKGKCNDKEASLASW